MGPKNSTIRGLPVIVIYVLVVKWMIGLINSSSTFEFHHQNADGLNSMNHQNYHQPSLFLHNLMNQSLFQVFFSWPAEMTFHWNH